MLKSNNNISIPILVVFIFFGCNREKSGSNEIIRKVDSVINLKFVDSSKSQFDTPPVQFNEDIEGYKATRLCGTIYSGEIEKFKNAIQNGAPLDQCLTDDTYIYDALYAALVFGKIQIVYHILKNKLYSDINQTYSEDAETSLTLACAFQNKDAALDVSRLLISKGANVNGSGDSGGEETKVPLLIAVSLSNVKLVQLLIEQGAKKDVTNSSGASPLSIAEEKGLSEIIPLLK